MADPFSDSSTLVSGLSAQMGQLENVTAQFGKTLSRSLVQGIIHGKSFEEMLKGLGDKLISLSLNAAFKPLEGAIGGLFSGLTGLGTRLLTGGFGATSGSLLPGLAAGAGMAAGSSGVGSAPLAITMNVTTPDAASFARAESQVSAALARAVARGQRSL